MGDLQHALFEQLTDSLDVPVFDHVPAGTDPPYVVIGTAWTAPFNEHGRLGYQPEFDVDVWSRYRGMSEVNAIAGEIVETLNHRYLDAGGWGKVQTRVTRVQPMRDADDVNIRHVTITCRCWLQQDVEPLPRPGFWTTGHGPPTMAARPGALYLDLDSGDIWEWPT